MKKLLTLTIITCFLAACSNNDSKQQDYSEWQDYTDAKEGYSLKYPKDWKTDSRENIVIFTSPKPEGDSFQENINIMVQDLSQQPMDLAAYTELSKGQIKDLLETEIQEESTGVIDGNKSVSVKYEMEYGTIKLGLKQYWFVKDNKAFLITYTATSATFPEYVDVVHGMVEHFKLKN